MGEHVSDSELILRFKDILPEMKRKEEESLKRLKVLYAEYMKKPLEEQLKMAREAMEYVHH
jgi:hypothetical protein